MGVVVRGASLPVVLDGARAWELAGPAIPVYPSDDKVEAGLATRIRFMAAGERRTEVGPALPVSLTPSRGTVRGPVQVVYAAPGYEWMEYDFRVRATEPGSLIAYWPLDEQTMPVCYDRSGNGRNGVYTACGMGQPGIGDGRTAAKFNGTTSFDNVYSASLAAAFNGAEGTLLIWGKVANVGVWTDGIQRGYVNLEKDNNNYIRLWKHTTNALYFTTIFGTTVKQIGPLAVTPTGYFVVALTWSKSADEVKAYYAGAQTGSTLTGLGTWSGTLAATTTVIGARTTTPAFLWSGFLAHCALWDKALAPAQVLSLGVL